MRVLVFGDSIAQGFFDTEGGWVNYLRKHYDEILVRNHDLNQPTIFNLAVSGDFTHSVLARFENEVKARIWPGEEFAFIFAVGTNDTLYRERDNDSEPDIYNDQLSKLLSLAKNYSHKIMFIGLFPVVDKLLQPAPFSETGKSYSTERIKLFDITLKNFCAQNNVACVDLWKEFTEQNNLESLLFDGLHPNGEGHELIYQIVKPKLQELLS